MARIRRFEPVQTAKVLGLVYGLVGLVLVPPLLLIAVYAPGEMGFGGSLATALMAPLLYALIGYIGTFIGCMVYNVAARWVGGIEVELEPDA